MKKIISLVLIATMMVFAFASCGSKKDGDDEKVIRNTITADEWAALANIKNFTIEMSGTSSFTIGEQTSNSTTSQILQSTETAMYEKSSNTTDEETYDREGYYTIKDDVRYELEKDSDGNWYASEYDWKVDTLLDCVTEEIDITFEKLTYNEEKKAYTYTDSEEGVTMTFSYFFEDGNLVKVTAEMSGAEESVTMAANISIVVSKIGTTTVTVPEFTADEE